MVGLGNPGPEYAETRHNVGWWFLDRLASKQGLVFKAEPRFLGEVARLVADGAGIWLLKPLTFMNRSGEAVAALCRFYRIEAERVLVVHDELDLPPGALRLKQGGGHGGHNGLRDLTRHLGPGFARLRIGIGHPGDKDRVTPYVLGRPSEADREAMDAAVDRGLAELPALLADDLAKVMNRLNRREPEPPC